MANQPSEPAVGDLCHGGSAHRFSVPIPTSVPGQRIWAGAIDSTCRFQASWDPSELPCPQAAIDAFNTPGREIVINTDEFVTDPTTCQVAPGLPQVHLHYSTPAFMRILFDVGGATYVRRVDFIKHS